MFPDVVIYIGFDMPKSRPFIENADRTWAKHVTLGLMCTHLLVWVLLQIRQLCSSDQKQGTCTSLSSNSDNGLCVVVVFSLSLLTFKNYSNLMGSDKRQTSVQRQCVYGYIMYNYGSCCFIMWYWQHVYYFQTKLEIKHKESPAKINRCAVLNSIPDRRSYM